MKCSTVFMLLTLSLLVSCEDKAPPKGELCVSTGFQASELACSNTALPKDKQKYFRHLKKNDLCTEPAQYERVTNYCMDLRADLIKCERNKK